MDTRYQVFISSTYADLKDERRIVMQAVLDLNCIPAGMELFPAADEQQFEYIKRVIDYSDYYVLIIGGRYGTITSEGISYTEKEYEYAASRGLQVIAFLHEAPGSIAYDKSETSPVLREKLDQFRKKVGTDRLIKPWRTPDQLSSLVTSSLATAIHSHPALGWVRADTPANVEVLAEINELRKENNQLRTLVNEISKSLRPAISDLAGLDESVKLRGRYTRDGGYGIGYWSVDATWRQVFAYVSPWLIELPSQYTVKEVLEKALFRQSCRDGSSPKLDDQEWRTVSVQLKALGLVNIQNMEVVGGGFGLFWSLTTAGEKLMLEVRTVRTKAANAET